jgi:hypothetical protein
MEDSIFPPLQKGSCEKFEICPLTLPSPARGEGKHVEMKNKFPPPSQKSLPSSLFQREESFGGFDGRFHFFPLWKRGMKGDFTAIQKTKLLQKNNYNRLGGGCEAVFLLPKGALHFLAPLSSLGGEGPNRVKPRPGGG